MSDSKIKRKGEKTKHKTREREIQRRESEEGIDKRKGKKKVREIMATTKYIGVSTDYITIKHNGRASLKYQSIL